MPATKLRVSLLSVTPHAENKKCSVEWCNRNVKYKGLCHRHYQQVRRCGKILDIRRSRFEKNEIIYKGEIAEIVMYSRKGVESGRTIVDIDMVDEIKNTKWFMNGQGYVAGLHNGKRIFLHRVVLETEYEVDHINHDTLDNRRSNLRSATREENNRNMKCRKDSSTGVKGVHKEGNRYRVAIKVDGKIRYFGRHDTLEAAANEYDDLARRYFGEFAYTNNIGGINERYSH